MSRKQRKPSEELPDLDLSIFDPEGATWRAYDEVARDRTRKAREPQAEAASPTFLSLEGDGAVTIPEAMQILRLSKDTLYKAMKAGHLHWVKVGRTRRIPKAALRDFIARHLKGGWAIPESVKRRG